VVIFSESALEFCLISEVFSAKCLKNEVILMNSAIYGRMRIGRCLQKESTQLHLSLSKDPMFLGCSVDVVHLMDEKCSGRNQCEVPGTNSELQSHQPCHQGLTLYLEADYVCLTGRLIPTGVEAARLIIMIA